MNKATKKSVSNCEIALAQIQSELETELLEIESISSEEMSKYWNLPSSIQDSDRGDKIQVAADMMESASGEIDVCVCHIKKAIEILKGVQKI